MLLDWLTDAQLDRVGCFKYEPVEGATANELGLPQVPDEVKEERWHRFMQHQQEISLAKLRKKIGTMQQVMVDEVRGDIAIGRTRYDAPEIDGVVEVHLGKRRVLPGHIVDVLIEDADAYDLVASLPQE